MIVLGTEGEKSDGGTIVLGREGEKERWRRSCARKRDIEGAMVARLC
jgi:hypothetical protein